MIHSNLALTLGTRLGVYEVTAPMGEGGMGQVRSNYDDSVQDREAYHFRAPTSIRRHEAFQLFMPGSKDSRNHARALAGAGMGSTQ